MGNPGQLVTTAAGKRGRTYNSEKPVNGKVVVHLLDNKFAPVLDANQKPMKVLCSPGKLTFNGYID